MGIGAVGPAEEREGPAAPLTRAAGGGIGARTAQAFSSLANVNFRFLLGGTLLSSFASWMEQIGQGWLVQQLTNSPFQLGLVQFIRGLSILLVSPFAGAVAERVDRRVLAGAASTANAANAVAIAVLVVSGNIAVWQLYVTAFVGGVCNSIYNPVRQFLVFDAVGEDHLGNAIALNSMVNNMARVVGPGIAGFMLSYSVSAPFFGEAVFLGAATLSLFQLKLVRTVQAESEPMLTRVRLGFSYLRRDRVLVRLTLLQAIPSALIFPYVQMVPNIARNYLHVGASGYGWLQTGVGIGSFVSALVIASFADVRHKGLIASIGLLAYMFMVLAFSFSRHYFLSLFCLIGGGLGLVVFSTFNQTLLQLRVDSEYRGRVLSLYTMSQGLNPFGSLLLGFVAQEFLGAPHAIALFCLVAIVLAVASGVASKEVRSL
jgi:MFS family permease